MKRNMYKLLALLLVMSMLLVGCGEKTDDIGGTLEAKPPVENTDDQSAVDQGAEAETPVTLGRMDGGTYTSTYAGISCTLDESWTFYSAEELQTLPDEVAAAMEEGSDIAELMAEAEQITDMQAENADLLCVMNVTLQKVSMQDRLVFAAMGEDEMIDLMIEENMDLFTESYAQIGMEVIDIQPAAVTFLGEERTALYTTATMEGIPVYMTQLFDYSLGSYSVTMTFTSYINDNSQTMLELFSAAE